mmetsp:Transcript_13464/g.42605  ORF Transcript_13464/g.42605 Transcript_13464/m.42605 type:complete len:285 (+) Transcript_13464:590-1444(+)
MAQGHGPSMESLKRRAGEYLPQQVHAGYYLRVLNATRAESEGGLGHDQELAGLFCYARGRAAGGPKQRHLSETRPLGEGIDLRPVHFLPVCRGGVGVMAAVEGARRVGGRLAERCLADLVDHHPAREDENETLPGPALLADEVPGPLQSHKLRGAAHVLQDRFVEGIQERRVPYHGGDGGDVLRGALLRRRLEQAAEGGGVGSVQRLEHRHHLEELGAAQHQELTRLPCYGRARALGVPGGKHRPVAERVVGPESRCERTQLMPGQSGDVLPPRRRFRPAASKS